MSSIDKFRNLFQYFEDELDIRVESIKNDLDLAASKFASNVCAVLGKKKAAVSMNSVRIVHDQIAKVPIISLEVFKWTHVVTLSADTTASKSLEEFRYLFPVYTEQCLDDVVLYSDPIMLLNPVNFSTTNVITTVTTPKGTLSTYSDLKRNNTHDYEPRADFSPSAEFRTPTRTLVIGLLKDSRTLRVEVLETREVLHELELPECVYKATYSCGKLIIVRMPHVPGMRSFRVRGDRQRLIVTTVEVDIVPCTHKNVELITDLWWEYAVYVCPVTERYFRVTYPTDKNYSRKIILCELFPHDTGKLPITRGVYALDIPTDEVSVVCQSRGVFVFRVKSRTDELDSGGTYRPTVRTFTYLKLFFAVGE